MNGAEICTASANDFVTAMSASCEASPTAGHWPGVSV